MVLWDDSFSKSLWKRKATLSVTLSYLPKNKSSNVGGLPVGGVKKMRQSYGWECGQNIRAVESKVQPLRAPPTSRDWNRDTYLQIHNDAQGQFKICEILSTQNHPHAINESRWCDLFCSRSLPLTVSDGVSQLAHGTNRHLASHTGHAGSATSSSSFGLCLRGLLWSCNFMGLLTFQKHTWMALDTLR